MTIPIQTSLTALIEQAIQAVQQGTALNPVPVGVLSPSTPAQIAALIDHTLLKPEAREAQIRQLCREAIEYGFASVCIHPTWVTTCASMLAGSPVKVCTVIGFPLGATLGVVKATETQAVIQLGAQEVDMVINVGRLKDQRYEDVYTDIAGVAQMAHANGALAKVIIETALLTTEEKIAACVISQQAGADFVKTSTGFSGGGATVDDIRLMRQVVGPTLGVKASGGIRTAVDAQQMVAAGATRIGASAGVRIVQDWSAQTDADAPAAVTGDAY